MLEVENCTRCEKRPDLCVCSEIPQLASKVEVLILQHPQEPDKDLGSARLAHLSLPNSKLKIGLSWPNLKAAVGHEAQNSEWAVLYLGSGIQSQGEQKPGPDAKKRNPGLQFVDRKGKPVQVPAGSIKGLVVLDGTWSQAKTLWWRNAWLLKLKRAILVPGEKSLYKELRREPRGECLSTIESIAEALTSLGEPKTTSEELKGIFGKLLDKQRERLRARRGGRGATRGAAPSPATQPAPQQNPAPEQSET